MSSRFVYVTYIRADLQAVWDALTRPEFTRQYWSGTWFDASWTPGAAWKLMIPDGRVGDSGEILECAPPTRLVLRWRNEFLPHLTAEGYSRATFDLTARAGSVQLTITHEMDKDDSQLIEGVASGWPLILASLKSLLETGRALPGTGDWPEGV